MLPGNLALSASAPREDGGSAVLGRCGARTHVVLVVDDDKDIRDLLSEALAGEGYSVVAARHGAEALERLRCRRADVILLDLMMPVMDGWQFREAQLRDPALAGIPVVVMSASDPAGISADARITKPVELDLLLATIERVARLAQDHGSVCTAGVVSGTCRSATEFMQ